MHSKLIVWLGLAGAVALALGWWLQQSEPSGSVAEAALSAAIPTAEFDDALPSEPAIDGTDDNASAVAREFARRIKLVPDTRRAEDPAKRIFDEREISAENIAALVQDNFEHALNGDTAASYFLARARFGCSQFADTPEELDQAIANTRRRVDHMRNRGMEIPARTEYDHPWAITDDDDANRRHLERWYTACEQVRGIYTPDLRRELDLLARKGHVMARYLYAMWPEETLDSATAFEQQFGWEQKARDYSQANMEAGEMVGLLAFSQSYINGMFTARNHNLALGFGLAALNCGFEALSVHSFLTSNLEHLTATNDPGQVERLQFIMDMADNVGAYCTP